MYNNININVSGPVWPSSTYKSVVLKSSQNFKAIVESEPNKKYIVKYNFDLGGETVIVPEGCLIEMDGGSISNGTMIGAHTILIYFQELSDCIKSVTMQGTWKYNNPRDGIFTENVYDETQQKTQKQVNSDVADDLGALGDKIDDKTDINATFSDDGKIYSDYNGGDIFYVEVDGVRKYRVAYFDGTADAEHPVTIDGSLFYYADNATDAVWYSLQIKNVSTSSQTLAANQKVQAQNNIVGKEYAPADFSGLGKKVFAKNIQEVGGVDKNIMTQAFFEDEHGNPLTNTVFIIQYDYDLMGESVEVPEGCALNFDGGSIRNGTVIGAKTILIGIPNIESHSGVFIDDTGCPLDKNLSKVIRKFEVEGLRARYDFGVIDETHYPLAGFSANCFTAINGYFVVFGYIKDNDIQYLHCAVFDYDYNVFGYSRIVDGNGNQFVSHAQGCTVKDGYIYVTNFETNGTIPKIKIEDLFENIDNGNLDTTIEIEQIPDLGGYVAGIYWNDTVKRWAIDISTKIKIFDANFNIISSDSIALIERIKPFFKNVYALQDIIYDGYFVYGTCSTFGQAGSIFFIYDVDKQEIVSTTTIVDRTETEGIAFKGEDIYIQGYDDDFIPIFKCYTNEKEEVFTKSIIEGQSELESGFSLYVDNSINKDLYGRNNYPFKYLSSALYYSRLLNAARIYIKKTENEYIGNINSYNSISFEKWGTEKPFVRGRFYINNNFSSLIGLKLYALNNTVIGARNNSNITIDDCEINTDNYYCASAYNSIINIKNSILDCVQRDTCLFITSASNCTLENVTIKHSPISVQRYCNLYINGDVTFDNTPSAFTQASYGHIETYFSNINHFQNCPELFKNSTDFTYDILFKVINNDQVNELINKLNSFTTVAITIGVIYIENSTAAGGTCGYSFKRGRYSIGGFGQNYVNFIDIPLRGNNNANKTKLEAMVSKPLDNILKACGFATQQSGGLFVSTYKFPVFWNSGDSILRLYFNSGFSAAKTKGTTAERPVGKHLDDGNIVGLLQSSTDIGFEYYDTTINKLIYAKQIVSSITNPSATGAVTWIEEDGAIAGVDRSGTTANRPLGSSIYVGFMYFDTSISPARPIYASAISGDTVTWVDATGTTV